MPEGPSFSIDFSQDDSYKDTRDHSTDLVSDRQNESTAAPRWFCVPGICAVLRFLRRYPALVGLRGWSIRISLTASGC